MSLSTIADALDALRAGRPVLVADDENRENEGDVILSAELATPEWVAWTVRWSSGFICAPMPAARAGSSMVRSESSREAALKGSVGSWKGERAAQRPRSRMIGSASSPHPVSS